MKYKPIRIFFPKQPVLVVWLGAPAVVAAHAALRQVDVQADKGAFDDVGGVAVALDGVWFCIRKKLFDIIRFDEDTYNGFHLYDVDISLQVYKTGHSLICIKDVLIHHQSIGVLNSNWLEAMHAFYFKWKKELPVSCIQFTIKEQAVIEYWVVTTFISDQLRIKGFDRKTKRKIFLSALKGILLFKKGLLYYKTPFWALQIALKYIKTFF